MASLREVHRLGHNTWGRIGPPGNAASFSPNVSVLPQSPRRTQRMTKGFLRIQAQQILELGTVFSGSAREKRLPRRALRSLRPQR